ncbi:hypothetical protein BH11PSE2_BH11PSE2_05440 [soil metagenome]
MQHLMVCLLAAAASSVAIAPAFAADAAKAPYVAPRAADGHADLEGFWTNSNITTLERPVKYGDRGVFTREETDQLENTEINFYKDKAKPVDPTLTAEELLAMDCGKGFTGAGCGYDAGWIDPGIRVARVRGEPRNSFITSPKNGRMPALTPAAQARMAELTAKRRADRSDNPEQRPLGERCITSWANHAGPVMLPTIYNNNYQIVQSAGAVAIETEVIHDTRMIQMTDKHGPKELRQWYGDSIGHWEGDTLVIETINYNPNQPFRGSDENLKVTERLTRVSDRRMLYQFTVADPTAWVSPWSGEYEFQRGEPIYEYACHEGNYALTNMLAGARAEDEKKATVASAAPAAKP